MLNWTTGPSNLAHAAEVMGLTHVVSSHRFVDRMAITVEGTEYLFLEDVRAFRATYAIVQETKVRGFSAWVLGPEDERTITRYNGNPAIGLGIVKQAKASTVEVADNIAGALPPARA